MDALKSVRFIEFSCFCQGRLAQKENHETIAIRVACGRLAILWYELSSFSNGHVEYYCYRRLLQTLVLFHLKIVTEGTED